MGACDDLVRIIEFSNSSQKVSLSTITKKFTHTCTRAQTHVDGHLHMHTHTHTHSLVDTGEVGDHKLSTQHCRESQAVNESTKVQSLGAIVNMNTVAQSLVANQSKFEVSRLSQQDYHTLWDGSDTTQSSLVRSTHVQLIRLYSQQGCMLVKNHSKPGS